MSKLKKKFGRRILAYLLSGAMIMSSLTSSNMTAFASETSKDTGGKYNYEETSEADDANADDAEEKAEADEVLRDEDNTSDEKEGVKESSDEAVEESKEKDSEQTSEAKSSDEEQASETKTANEEKSSEAKPSDEEQTSETESSSSVEEEDTEEVREKVQADEDVRAYDASIKTDVWDFGGATVENVNNMITTEELSGSLESTAIKENSGTVNIEDLTIYNFQSQIITLNDNGYTGGFEVYGYYNNTHYGAITINAKAGDVITVALYEKALEKVIFADTASGGILSNTHNLGGTSTQNRVTIDYTKLDSVQSFTPSATQKVEEAKFYAPKDGTYAILSGSNTETKTLYIARITREHVDEVAVSGSVTAPSGADLLNATLTFTDDATNETKEVTISSNSYSVNLYNKHSYTISASEGFEVADDCKTLDLSNNSSTSKTHDVTLSAAAATAELTGVIEVPEGSDLLDSLKLSFVEADNSEKSVEAVITKAAKTYTAELKTGVKYTIKSEADYINDYELDTSRLNTSIYADGAVTISETAKQLDITYNALTTYPVAFSVSGKNVDGNDITVDVLKQAGARLVFTRNDSDAYEYTVKAGDAIKLREGTYSVKTENSVNITDKNNTIDDLDAKADKSAYIAKSPISNLTVGTNNNSLAIEYQYASEWDFTSTEFQNTKLSDQSILYNGLFIKYAKRSSNKLYVYSYPQYSTIRIPVKGACRVTFEIDSLAETKALKEVSGGTGNEKEIAISNGKYIYDYTGTEEGAVIVGITSGNYDGGNISKITVTYAKQIKIASNITNGSVSATTDGKTSAIPGDTVKLSDVATAEPDEGYAFSSWKVTDADGTEVSVSGSSADDYSFEMPESDVTISAEFIELGNEHTIHIADASDIQNGTVTAATGDDSITKAAANASVDLALVATAEPAENYVLSMWEITYQDANNQEQKIEVQKNAEGKYIFTMPDSDVTVKPIFVRQYEINIAAAASIENGTVTAKSQEQQYAVQGDKILLKNIAEATPNTGYEFKEWKVTYGAVGGEATATVTQNDDGDDVFTMPDSNVTVSAVFDKKAVKYVAEGTYDFGADYKTLVIDGFTFDGFKHEGNSHGCQFSDGATMKLNLKEKANITVISCCFGSGESVTLEASSGKNSSTVEEEPNTGKNRKKFTVLGATGELTLTFGGGSWIHSVAVEYPGEVEAGSRNIDVWDFGALAQDKTDVFTYNNNITAAGLKDIVNTSSTGTKGAFKGGTTAFGDLTMVYNSGDRLYTNVGDLADYNAGSYGNAQYKYEDFEAAGAWYCNGTGGATRRYVTVKMQAGDKLIAYMGSAQNGDIDFTFEGQGGAEGQSESVTIASGTFQKCVFVAEKTGTYKIWADAGNNGKPMYHRFVRVPAVEVSGRIDYDGHKDAVSNAVVKFKNITTKTETEAEVDASGNFKAILAPGFEYRAVLSGAMGYGFDSATKNFETKDEEYKTGKSGITLKVVTQTVYTYSGEIVGFAEGYDTSKLAMTMVADKDSEAEDADVTISQKDNKITFETTLQPEVVYTFALEGVNDYEVKEPDNVNNEDGSDYTNKTVTVQLKPMYSVTGAFIGLDDSAQVTALKFTNVEDKYVYDAAVNADGKGYSVELRDGEYLAAATVNNFSTQTHVIVEGAAVSRDLLFVSTTAKDKIAYAADIYVGYPDKANNYETVSKAMEACELMNPAPTSDSRVTVHIAPGTYREQIIVKTPYVSLVNDTDKEVLLTWYYGIGYKYYSADSSGYYNPEKAFDKYEKNIASRWGVAVYVRSTAKAFRAEGITFENSFNRYITDEELEDGVEFTGETLKVERKRNTDVESKAATERAAAIAVEGDEAEFKDCGFYSSQDTVYTGAVKAYFKNCVIEGQTDYIFGEASNIVFDACELSWKGYSSNSQGGYITAPRASGAKGYLFRSCTVTANKHNGLTVTPGYFGRPWGADAAVIFMNTKLQNADMITAAGWNEMSGNQPENANFKEYNTTTVAGDSVDTSSRKGEVLSAEEAANVKAEDYFGSWVPSYYVAEADTVEFVEELRVTDNGDINAPYPGHTLTAKYSLGAANDANDASVIQWYIVDKNGDGTETLVKESTASVDKTYQIQKTAIGKFIKVKVTPQTISGKVGTPAEYMVEEVVRDGWDDPSGGSDIELGDGVNIFLAGDSTVKDYSANGMYNSGKPLKEGAWGEFIQYFFDSSKVTIQNYAQGGRSCRTFINEGKLDSIKENMSEGDYLFIQFGHNDCADTYPDRYVPVGTPDGNGVYPSVAGTKDGNGEYPNGGEGTFKWFLKQYIDAAKEKGAIPVLVTPVARLYYTSDGKIRTHHDSASSSNNAYVTAVKQLAEEEKVLLIDGYELTKNLFEEAWTADGNNNDTYGKQIMAEGDKTHNNKLGGMIEAAVIAGVIQNMNLSISPVVKAPENVLGETPDGKEVFSVNRQGKLTANDILTGYTTKAAYWETIGQNMFDAIKEKAGEVTPGPGDNQTVGEVEASPSPEQPVGKNTLISLTCVTEGVDIYYTMDGTDPTVQSTPYTKPFSLGENEGTVTVKAFAVKEGWKDSEIATFVYTVSADVAEQVSAPEADPKPEAYVKGALIRLFSSTPDAQIYYTLDGSAPTKESTPYTEPFALGGSGETVTVNAIAIKEGCVDSVVSTFVYTISDNSDEETSDTEESKITVGGNPEGKAISVRDTGKITIEAADLVETNKVQYAVTVTYTYVDKDNKTYQQQLTEGVHYTVSLVKGYDGKSPQEQRVNVTGTDRKTDLGTFTDKKTVSYTIKSKEAAKQDKVHDISKAKLSLSVKNAVYTGTYVTPEVRGLDSSYYNVVYKNNVNVGKASVTVIGKAPYYGSKTLTFNIKKADISKNILTMEAANADISRSGKDYVASEKTNTSTAFVYSGKEITLENLTILLGDVKLSPRADYTVAYKNNTKKGTATVTIKGVNNLSGSARITYVIRTIDAMEELQAYTSEENALPAEYSSKGARLPEITVNGVTLKEGKDYKVDYKGCTAAAVGSTGQVKITGLGSYKDKLFKNMPVYIKVEQGRYHMKDGVVINTAKMKWNTPKIINAARITDAAGVKIKAADVTIETTDTEIIVMPKDTENYLETTLKCYTMRLASVKLLKGAKIEDKYFDGVNSVTLTETEIAKILTGVEAKDICIVSYRNNNKVGTATVTIEGRSTSAFYGRKNVKFRIVGMKTQLGSFEEEVPDTEEGSGTEPKVFLGSNVTSFDDTIKLIEKFFKAA